MREVLSFMVYHSEGMASKNGNMFE